MSRRTFLSLLLGVSASLGLAGLLAPIIRYASPVVNTGASANIMVATKSDLEAAGGEMDFDYQDVPAALVQLDDGTVVGLSRVCTHLGCIISWRSSEELFNCPCHAGIFSPIGEVVSGPPPKPLPMLSVVEKGDEIWVDGWQEA